MSSSQNANASEPPALPLLDSPRTSVTDFGGLTPRYHVPMYYPTEVNLYEPSVAATSGSGGAGSRRSSAIKAEVNIPLPCGYFNFWRPLHDNATPICSKLERYFPESAPTSTTLDQWDSRISYSSADDEYYENGRLLPFIKAWSRGVLHTRNVFRNIEPDWGMSYLAPNTQSPNLQSLAVWRFNYVESRRAIRSFHAVLSYSVFSSAASIQWYIRPLSQLQFKPIPAYILTADEAQSFPEIANHKRGHSGDGDIDAASRTRARIIERHRGEILRYMDKPDEFNSYASHSVPALATDLSEHVKGEYGFEIAAAFFPESEGDNRWQKVQIARQVLNRPVGGRMLEGEDAMARCGLDFRIKLQDDVVVRETPLELRDALASVSTLAGLPPTIDDDSCDFVIRVSDPDNVVGSLQPPIRAHERVLAVGSEYFAALLSSSMAESAAKQVDLDNMPYGPVRLAINYLYTERIPCDDDMHLGDWIALLDVSSRLSIPQLHQLCQARIFQEALAAGQSCAEDEEASDTDTAIGYQDVVGYPDMSTIDYLQDVANDTGARELSSALSRLVAYYPIQVCEERVRNGPTETFAPRTASSSIRIRRVVHNELLDPNPALFGHPHGHPGQQPFEIIEQEHLEHEFDDHEFDDMEGDRFAFPAGEPRHPLLHIGGPAFMPGLVIHPGILEVPARPRPAEMNQAPAPAPAPAPEQRGGLFGRLMGNWRVVNNNQADADAPPPPDPQPGPVPELPRPDPTSAARLDASGEPQTLTQPPQDPQPGPAPPPPEAGHGL